MIPTTNAPKYIRALTIALLLVIFGNSCSFSLSAPARQNVTQTALVTQLATVVVTRQVTQEVTRIVEVPVTITPADTSLATLTPSLSSGISGSPAPSSEAPEVTILEHSDCLYGPGLGYLYKYSVFINNPMEVVGRNFDGSWLYIQDIGGWNPCWIQAALVKLPGGDINGLPIVYSRLPYSNQYNSPDASAHRDGAEVTISWKADWMSLDDYRGYLIEAWICQGGVQIFDPISYVPPLASNIGILSIKLTDEPGCALPSVVKMYSAQKQGYSIGSNVLWPPAITTPGP
jgi:hypothetical protein